MLPSNNRRGGTKGAPSFAHKRVGTGTFLYSPVMDHTLKFKQCDQGCCFWIDGVAVKEDEFWEARASPASGFYEEGKRAGANPPAIIIVSCPQKRPQRPGASEIG
jgi:hypothetical protein